MAINNYSLINVLNKRIDFLRAVVLIILAGFILLTILTVSLIFYYTDLNTDLNTELLMTTSVNRQTAALYLVPNIGKYRVDDEFDINVLIDTKGNNVVVSAAYLSYQKDRMEALAIDTSDSVFSLEAEKEIISQEGKIKITLGKPTPGINLNEGKIATVRFKALKPISPQVNNIDFNFTLGSSNYSTVILDNKLGTNILSHTSGAKIYIE